MPLLFLAHWTLSPPCQMSGGLGAVSKTELHSEIKREISILSFAYENFSARQFRPRRFHVGLRVVISFYRTWLHLAALV